MNEITNKGNTHETPIPSRFRAFFSTLIIGWMIVGMARSGHRRDFSYSDNIYLTALGAWSGGILFASFFAIKFRDSNSYFLAAIKTYLAFVVGTFLFGLLGSNFNVAAIAALVGLFAGILFIFPGVALFYWRNLFTNIIFWIIILINILALIVVGYYIYYGK